MKKIFQTLSCVGIVLAASSVRAETVFLDGVGAPTLSDPIVIGDFDDGTTQGWSQVRIDAIGSVGGTLQNTNPGGLGSDGNADSYVRANMTSANAPAGNPNDFTVGNLPGQHDIIQYDLRFDVLPPEDPGQPGTGNINPALKGRIFLSPNGTDGEDTYDNAHLQSLVTNNDNGFHTHTLVLDSGDAAWGKVKDQVRFDILDGLNNNAGNSDSVLGTKFSLDNVLLGRSNNVQPFPAVSPVQPNIVKNGDLSNTSNVVLGGTNTGAFNINGGHGNFGPFRGNTGDVDHWTPYNNDPNGIVAAVNGPDGTGLNLLHSSNGNQGSFYLDTHYGIGTEQFSLNSAGGYQNGLIQTDILNGVTIDVSATYELAFDINFNAARPSNPNSNFKLALTVGTNSTDPNTAVAGSVFDKQLSDITTQGTQTLSISGAALKAAQDSGDPVNLIFQSLANTSIVNFPGTPVPDNHADGAVFTQVTVDNLSLIRTFAIQPGDVNKDGFLTQADVDLAQLYLDGNGSVSAADRQNTLIGLGNSSADVLASLNLNDFDVTGNDFFDAADVAAIAAAVPEPTSLVLVGLALSAVTLCGRRRS
ncbi:PEP-CTERM sorting domain-containing protein [Bythopirellula polymerisocia]|uniref:Ice-binding protein C-terminal domain-containing protein n=1 Tax=Bythopirellula polymerisocia TaxID=2528003 RepID=A0A5C6CXR0_9BACT|nr:PEP-CTERM sorting domain-containing protein [Bythopirellula polymerisocia]TWU28685.1 hypothetical protein Pla144_19770 [Bythopirellula polymerisocia]